MSKKPSPKMFSSAHLPEWLNLKVVAFIILLGLFMIGMSWSRPQASASRDVAGVAWLAPTARPPAASGAGPSPTPVPAEWAANREMSSGIVLGAVVLVLIIIGGTLGAIRRK